MLFDTLFYSKSLGLCPKMVLPLEYIALVAMYTTIPGFYRVIVINVRKAT